MTTAIASSTNPTTTPPTIAPVLLPKKNLKRI